MTATTTAPATKDAAFLARLLADVLGLGLPDPRYLTVSPRSPHHPFGLQFDDEHALRAWAEHFGSEVRTSAAPKDGDPDRVYVESVVRFGGLHLQVYGFFGEV
jgi:hypothetical protein